jgi:hypothetical protein
VIQPCGATFPLKLYLRGSRTQGAINFRRYISRRIAKVSGWRPNRLIRITQLFRFVVSGVELISFPVLSLFSLFRFDLLVCFTVVKSWSVGILFYCGLLCCDLRGIT